MPPTMRIRLALTALFTAALALQPPSLHAQDRADTVHAKQAKDTLAAIRKRSTSVTIRRWVDWLVARENALVTPPAPVPIPVPTTTTLSAPSTTLLQGKSTQVNVVVTDQNGAVMSGVPLLWKAGDSTILNVSATGIATGRKAGQGVVWATPTNALGAAGSLTIAVQDTALTPTPPDTVTPQPPSGGFDGIAELPRALPTPVYSAPCAVTVTVTAGMDLQQAINMIQPGGCLALAQGATFANNYTLPAKSGNAWVTITTSGVQLPPPGTRMTPSLAGSLRLAKISQTNYSPTIAVAPGAHHYRFIGVEITPTAAAQTSGVNMIVALYDQSAQWSVAGLAHDIQFIQSYVHGSSTLDTKRCFRLDARYLVVVDSWISDCHSNLTDSQGGLFLAGAGYVLIRNNHVEGGHQAFMSGGGDPPDSTLQPHDIALIGNHIYHPASWKGVWQAKTVLETKNVRRLLIEGNVIENSWADAQAGFCFLMKSENQDGTAPWTTTSDVVIRYNVALRCGSVFNFSGKGSKSTPNITMARVSMHDLRADSVNFFKNADGIGGQMLGPIDVQVTKTTITNGLTGFYSNQALSFDGGASVRFVFDANVVGHGNYGVKGSGTSDGNSTLTTYAPGAVFTNNAFVLASGQSCGTYPATNNCPTSLPAPSTTLGADFAAIAQKTAGVVVTDPLMAASRSARAAAPLKVRWAASKAVCQTAKNGALPASCDRRVSP